MLRLLGLIENSCLSQTYHSIAWLILQSSSYEMNAMDWALRHSAQLNLYWFIFAAANFQAVLAFKLQIKLEFLNAFKSHTSHLKVSSSIIPFIYAKETATCTFWYEIVGFICRFQSYLHKLIDLFDIRFWVHWYQTLRLTWYIQRPYKNRCSISKTS